MPKVKTTFFCQNCGAQSSKWIGKCPSCQEWNTYTEEIVQKSEDNRTGFKQSNQAKSPSRISEITLEQEKRIVTKDAELNRVLGGGIVQGSLVLVGGEPGIGKSTLMLQLALSSTKKVLYVSGEESEKQIKMRAERLGKSNSDCFVLTETLTQNIFKHLKKDSPELVIIDSIQTLYTGRIESTPGSVSQIRECAGELLQYAKETGTPIFIIGHITKEGYIAGPKVLEHMVDTVLQFEGDANYVYRLLRATKNRFGSTNELGIYEMINSGLREIHNPSEVLISPRESEELSGVAIAAAIEGHRPFLIEVQALVSTAAYGTPQRSSTGFDLRRLNMLLAVLEKRCGFKLGSKDVFLNIAGGIKVNDPSIDLAVICAILSSGEDIEVPSDICFSAEVGLSGEIRPVNRVDQRILEAEKMGFKTIFISKNNHKSEIIVEGNTSVIRVGKIDEVFNYLFA